MTLRYANLILLILFPVAWFAPLLRAGFLPIFGLSEISIISGLQSLWISDVTLALLVTFLAIFAPYMKVIGVALVQFKLLHRKTLPALEFLGKLAMADIFLISLYVVIFRDDGYVKVETGWGLYLFTICVIASLSISHLTRRL
ncbi:paraquat-inducible protein A [Pseudopelagicola sp. nBUS_20]|uniref:paraquat-inducible protein A n=1 Tax=Pseudopelagicola sp. nBUS_20 TaxID=3395317 RepID=UPI003EBA6FB1